MVYTDKRRSNICCEYQKDVRINVLKSFFVMERIAMKELVFRVSRKNWGVKIGNKK